MTTPESVVRSAQEPAGAPKDATPLPLDERGMRPCRCGCKRTFPPVKRGEHEKAFWSDAHRARYYRRSHPRRKPAGEGRPRPDRHEVALSDYTWLWVRREAAMRRVTCSEVVRLALQAWDGWTIQEGRKEAGNE